MPTDDHSVNKKKREAKKIRKMAFLGLTSCIGLNPLYLMESPVILVRIEINIKIIEIVF